MNKNDDVRVAEIAARAETATEGPWEVDDNRPFSSELQGIFATGSKRYVLAVGFDRQPENAADAAFIAHAREDIPFLLSEVRRLRSVVEDAEAELVTVKQQRSDNLRAIAERDAVIAALHERLDQPTRPYGDPTFAMITERASIRELYGPEIVDDIDRILSTAPATVLADRDAATWDACLDAIEQHELNTAQAREGNPYRTGEVQWGVPNGVVSDAG